MLIKPPFSSTDGLIVGRLGEISELRVYNLSGIQLKINPLAHQPGDLLRSVNLETFPTFAKRKRPGYVTYLGTMPNGSAVQGLFNFSRNNGTQFWNYAFAGGLLYYSQQGTGDWTISGNGTFSPAGTITHAVLEDTLCVSDGVGSVFNTTTGTSFSGAAASPPAVSLEEYHQRIYAAGTASNLFWSNVGTPGDWTNDSSSVLVPGEGIVGTTFNTMPGTTHQYRYYATIGTVTDDLTDETISDAIAVYDFQNNDWWNYKFANKPTAWLSFKDVNGNEQLVFGAADAQCYQIAGTATTDNGASIETVMEGVIHAGA